MVGTGCLPRRRSQVTDKQIPLFERPQVLAITFKALLKVGPANTGEFYRAPDLVLEPPRPETGDGSSISSTWVIAPAGGSCDIACHQLSAVNKSTSSSGMTQDNTQFVCDENAMRAGLDTPTEIAAALSPVYPCNGPLIASCVDMPMPATTTVPGYRHCLYKDDLCRFTADIVEASGRELCSLNTTTSIRRFCACSAISPSPRRNFDVRRHQKDAPNVAAAQNNQAGREAAARRRELRNAAAVSWEKATGDVLHGTAPHENWRPSGEFWYNPITGATSRAWPVHKDGKTNDDEGNDNYNDISAEPPLKLSAAAARSDGMHRLATLMCLLLPLVCNAEIRQRGSFSSILILLLLVIGPFLVQAHNWIQTPRRGGSFVDVPSIATEQPCGGRRPEDIHYQVGPDQQFAVKFSAGHSGPYYFLVIPGTEMTR